MMPSCLAESALFWCGAALLLTGVVQVGTALNPVRRERRLFYRPGLLWRVLHGELPVCAGLACVGGWLLTAGGAGEAIRLFIDPQAGTLCLVPVLLTGTGVLINTARRVHGVYGLRLLLSALCSGCLLRLLWLLWSLPG